MAQTKLAFVIMDPPYETGRSTTALRLMAAAAKRGYDINVFAYEGAVYMPFAKQAPHANAMHGHDVEQEAHPNPKDWIKAIQEDAARHGGKLDWINCGLCVDERGAAESIDGIRRGGPADLLQFVNESDNTLVIPTR